MPNRPTPMSLLVLAAGLAAGCGPSEAEPLGQILLSVDTDLPAVAQLTGRDDLSHDAAVDTLRIDVLDRGGGRTAGLTVNAFEASSWPISFGIAPGPSPARIRLRAYRAQLATGGEPPIWGSIDRVVVVQAPAEAIARRLVTLSGDCLARPPVFGVVDRTCIDGEAPDAPATEGIVAIDAAPRSKVGTWRGAIARACAGPDDPDAPCIAGGFSILGDERLAGYADGILLRYDPVPPRPALLSPFRLDRTEMTVGRFRALFAAHAGEIDPPRLSDPSSATWKDCQWLGPEDGSHDEMPLNCVTWDTAERACELSGGHLPTEARWEHAARGRGRGLLYPWGDGAPSCCAASIGRGSLGSVCGGVGMEPPGSHAEPSACGGLADVSVDGVVDLVGGVSEWTLDRPEPFDGDCWDAPGILADPSCEATTVKARSRRGAGWTASLDEAPLPARQSMAPQAQLAWLGFRCARDASP